MAQEVLVVYYSHSGNTRRLAELIRSESGGHLCEIVPASPYPRDYGTVVDQAKREIRQGFHPAIVVELATIEQYREIFVGSPNWWSTIAPPVATFLLSFDFSGKTILPFCTHGGGGGGRIEGDIAELCPQATVLSCLEVYGRDAHRATSDVSRWLGALPPLILHRPTKRLSE